MFGIDAVEDLRTLEFMELDEWQANNDPDRVMEIISTTESDRQLQVRKALVDYPKRVLVARGCSGRPTEDYASLIRAHVSYMPIECQSLSLALPLMCQAHNYRDSSWIP